MSRKRRLTVTTSWGNIDQLSEVDLRSQMELEEPQANSTLLEPADEPVDSTTVGETRTEAGEDGSKLGLQQAISSSLLKNLNSLLLVVTLISTSQRFPLQGIRTCSSCI